jgi:hypothetical protein
MFRLIANPVIPRNLQYYNRFHNIHYTSLIIKYKICIYLFHRFSKETTTQKYKTYKDDPIITKPH